MGTRSSNLKLRRTHAVQIRHAVEVLVAIAGASGRELHQRHRRWDAAKTPFLQRERESTRERERGE